jgi:hypothetical protein
LLVIIPEQGAGIGLHLEFLRHGIFSWLLLNANWMIRPAEPIWARATLALSESPIGLRAAK